MATPSWGGLIGYSSLLTISTTLKKVKSHSYQCTVKKPLEDSSNKAACFRDICYLTIFHSNYYIGIWLKA